MALDPYDPMEAVLRALAHGHSEVPSISAYVGSWAVGIRDALNDLAARGRATQIGDAWRLVPHADMPPALLVDHWSIGRQHCRPDLQYVVDRLAEEPSISWEQLCLETHNFGFPNPREAIDNRIPYYLFDLLKG